MREWFKEQFKIGDEVIIKEDIQSGKIIGKELVTDEMAQHKGKITKIIEVDSGGYIALEIDSGVWAWTEEMLEKINK